MLETLWIIRGLHLQPVFEPDPLLDMSQRSCPQVSAFPPLFSFPRPSLRPDARLLRAQQRAAAPRGRAVVRHQRRGGRGDRRRGRGQEGTQEPGGQAQGGARLQGGIPEVLPGETTWGSILVDGKLGAIWTDICLEKKYQRF